VVPLEGQIVDKGGDAGMVPWNASLPADRIARRLDALAADRRIGAVVLRIQSPGGSVAGSERLRRAVERLAKKKPVVASLGSSAASGGYMLALPDAPADEGKVTLSKMNFGDYPMVNYQYRISARFYGEEGPLAAAKAAIGQPQGAQAALALGLVTATPDDLDWDEEIRIVLEERASLSPDALTGMEANLRFGPGETMETRVFGRLSAWQNWIFIRPNAVGEGGALKVFGSGNKAKFDWNRV
jgi:benzoyl-CoA-dihydrodiol lyase